MTKMESPGLGQLTRKLKSIKAKDIMTSKVIATREDVSLTDIAKLMIEARISGLPVIGKKGDVVGIITASDLFVVMDMIKSGDVMENGRLLQFGETWEVYHHPVSLTVMEMTSRLEVNTMRVEIADGKIRPYNLPVDRKDGTYLMAFRSEEVELVEEGIPADISFSRFFDGKYKQAFCTVGEDVEVNLMLSNDQEGHIVFVPTHPQFFHI